MINNNTKVGFDAQNRPIVAYHKFDSAGNTQLYNARFEGGPLGRAQDVELDLPLGVRRPGDAGVRDRGRAGEGQRGRHLTQRWYHAQYGGWNAFALDPTTLAATAMLGRSLPYPVLARDRAVDDRRHARPLGRRLGRRPRRATSSTCCAGRRSTRTATWRAPRSRRRRACASTRSRSRDRLSTPSRCRASGSSRTSSGTAPQRAALPPGGCRSRRAGSGCSSRGTASRRSAAASAPGRR